MLIHNKDDIEFVNEFPVNGTPCTFFVLYFRFKMSFFLRFKM